MSNISWVATAIHAAVDPEGPSYPCRSQLPLPPICTLCFVRPAGRLPVQPHTRSLLLARLDAEGSSGYIKPLPIMWPEEAGGGLLGTAIRFRFLWIFLFPQNHLPVSYSNQPILCLHRAQPIPEAEGGRPLERSFRSMSSYKSVALKDDVWCVW